MQRAIRITGNICSQMSLASLIPRAGGLWAPTGTALLSCYLFSSTDGLLQELLLWNKDGTSLVNFCYKQMVHSLMKSMIATKGNHILSFLKWQDSTTTYTHTHANWPSLSCSQLASKSSEVKGKVWLWQCSPWCLQPYLTPTMYKNGLICWLGTFISDAKDLHSHVASFN